MWRDWDSRVLSTKQAKHTFQLMAESRLWKWGRSRAYAWRSGEADSSVQFSRYQLPTTHQAISCRRHTRFSFSVHLLLRESDMWSLIIKQSELCQSLWEHRREASGLFPRESFGWAVKNEWSDGSIDGERSAGAQGWGMTSFKQRGMGEEECDSDKWREKDKSGLKSKGLTCLVLLRSFIL